MCFKEDPYLYSNTNPKIYPDRPPDDFNVDLIQLHIARIGSLVEEATAILKSYFYVVSWRNPAVTGSSLVIYILICLNFSAEYFGRLVQEFTLSPSPYDNTLIQFTFPSIYNSLPIAMIIFCMLYCAYIKKNGGFMSRLIKKERDARFKVRFIDHTNLHEA